jgi:hypothetical protein
LVVVGAGEVLAKLLGHSAIIYSVAATADGRIASGAARCSQLLPPRRWVCTAVLTSKVAVSWLWSGAGEVLAELLGHSAIIYSVAATADGRIASGEVQRVLLLLQSTVQPTVGMLLSCICSAIAVGCALLF